MLSKWAVRRGFLVGALLLALAAPVRAQSFKLAWDQSLVPQPTSPPTTQPNFTLAQVNGFVYALTIGTGSTATTVQIQQTCVAKDATTVSCTAPAPTNAPGKQLTLQAFNGSTPGGITQPLLAGPAPAAAGGFTITIVITLSTP